jgi:lipopolysaccharide transport system permease protein
MIKTFQAAWVHRELLLNLTQRELRNRYRRTVLGWLWSMINPAITTAVYTFAFAVVFKAKPAPGDPSGLKIFAFFLLSGLLPWNFLAGGLGGGIGSILGAGSLITRVFFPRELIPMAAVLSLTVTVVIELGVLAVMEAIAGYYVFRFLPVVLFLVVLQTFFVLGLALWLSALNVRYRDVQHLVGVFLLVLFYLTPVVYSVGFLPEQWTTNGVTIPVRTILLLNPMSRFVMAYRNCFYDLRLPGFETIAACVFWSVASLSFGSAFFRSRAKRFAEDM